MIRTVALPPPPIWQVYAYWHIFHRYDLERTPALEPSRLRHVGWLIVAGPHIIFVHKGARGEKPRQSSGAHGWANTMWSPFHKCVMLWACSFSWYGAGATPRDLLFETLAPHPRLLTGYHQNKPWCIVERRFDIESDVRFMNHVLRELPLSSDIELAKL